MVWRWVAVLLVAMMLLEPILAANHVIERSVIKGVGYRSHEMTGQTAQGQAGQKITERISGSGSFYDKTEYELDVVNNSIRYNQYAVFDYFPTSYQTGTYNQKWSDKLCVINYDAGAVATEMYTHSEHLEKQTGVYTFGNSTSQALNMQISANVIGVAHIGWISRDVAVNSKGRHAELGRSTEDLVGVFSIEKYIQLQGNSTNSTSSVDWMPCV